MSFLYENDYETDDLADETLLLDPQVPATGPLLSSLLDEEDDDDLVDSLLWGAVRDDFWVGLEYPENNPYLDEGYSDADPGL